MAYLRAIGIDTYVARQPLPGAAASHPLAHLSLATGAPGQEAVPADGAAKARTSAPADLQAAAVIESLRSGGSQVATPASPAARATLDPARTDAQAQPSFTVAACRTGDVLWLEELEHEALATEQAQLLRAIAFALGVDEAPAITQFNWPIHHNRQLDQSEAAAVAALQGFVDRQVDVNRCVAVVLLGDRIASRLQDVELRAARQFRTRGTGEMLADPSSKALAWRDLRSLRSA